MIFQLFLYVFLHDLGYFLGLEALPTPKARKIASAEFGGSLPEVWHIPLGEERVPAPKLNMLEEQACFSPKVVGVLGSKMFNSHTLNH